jgi:hypothetical protein
MMLAGAATARRSGSLRLYQGQSEPGEQYRKQQTGN